jgi:hypothetical protein
MTSGFYYTFCMIDIVGSAPHSYMVCIGTELRGGSGLESFQHTGHPEPFESTTGMTFFDPAKIC